MVEEFQEADVLWPEHNAAATASELTEPSQSNGVRRRESSAPISIPTKGTGSTSKSWTVGFAYRDTENDDVEDGRTKKITPPHVLGAQRMDEKVAYSVCTGNGRTLKGRDLTHVRDSVLRLTGFIER